MTFPNKHDAYHCEKCEHLAFHAAPIPMLLARDLARRDRWRKETGTAERRAWVTA